MRYRRLGTSDLELSEISFGTADNAGLMVKASERERVDAVAFAIEAGINYFETSPSFGRGVAEEHLGQALRAVGAQPHLGTMVELVPDDFERIDEALGAALDGSLQRLGVDGVDVLIVHNPPRKQHDPSEPAWKPVTVDDMLGPAVKAFEKARAAGKARYFGFATELSDPESVFTLLQSGHFTLMNAWYSLINPTAARAMPAAVSYSREYPQYGRIIEEARRNNVGVAAFRVLNGGALSDRIIAGGPTARHPNAGGLYSRDPQAFAAEIARARPFSFLGTPTRTLTEAAYAYVLMNPGVTTVVAGFSDITQMRELLAAYPPAPLTADELARIETIYESDFGLPTTAGGL